MLQTHLLLGSSQGLLGPLAGVGERGWAPCAVGEVLTWWRTLYHPRAHLCSHGEVQIHLVREVCWSYLVFRV